MSIDYFKKTNGRLFGSNDRESKKKYITSFGVILFTIQDGEILYQMCKPRDSVTYVSFMRGLYTKRQLNFFLSLMTNEELNRLKKYSFDELWDDLWHNRHCRIKTSEYGKAKRRFTENIASTIAMISDMTLKYCNDHMWGFPKGKKTSDRESNLDAAIREFEEETHINPDNIKIVSYVPLIETYYGSNGKLYKTLYYTAQCDKILNHEYEYTNTSIRDKREIVSDEVSEIKWMNIEDCIKILSSRPYRQRMLNMLNENILESIK